MAPSEVGISFKTGQRGLYIRVRSGDSWYSHWVTPEKAVTYAADLLCIASIVGESGSSVFVERLQAFRENLSDLVNDLNELQIAKPGEACTVCGRVIFNAANMERHMKTHEVTT